MAKNQSTVTGLDDDATQDASNGATATAAAPEAKEVLGVNHDSEMSGVRRMVTIHPTDADGGGDAVPVGVNGFMYQIPRGVPCSVPEEVLDILKNAVGASYKAGANGLPDERAVPRFAYTVG